MNSTIETEEMLHVGEATIIESKSPRTEYAVVFEDDGETGYFYGLDTTKEEHPILDALHIYNVDNVVDKEQPSLVQIEWSSDGLKAALRINNYPHAVVDFAAKRSYCRTNFPTISSPESDWSRYSKKWTVAAMALFR